MAGSQPRTDKGRTAHMIARRLGLVDYAIDLPPNGLARH